MKNQKKLYVNLCITLCLLTLFILWTVLLSFVDKEAVGPENSSVGFSTLNVFFHELTGVHMAIYTITDWLGLVPVFFCLGFGLLGLIQLIKRKSLLKVDADILVLGGFYIVVIAAYLFFEMYAVNYRPILIDGYLEASYPSSTTLLVLCVMPTAILQFRKRIHNLRLQYIINIIIAAFTAFMVIGRLISGVHWLSDIIGGLFLSAGLVMMYQTINRFINKEK